MDDYPSNSRNPKPEVKVEKKKVEKIVSGSVTRRKKTLGRRFYETFIGGGEAQSVLQHILQDVLVPAGKEMLYRSVTEGTERALNMDVRSRAGGVVRTGQMHVNYNRISTPQSILAPREDPRREMSNRARQRHNFDEIVFEKLADAEEVLDLLQTSINTYQQVSVGDFYDAVGIASSFADQKYGWTDLSNAGISRISGGGLVLDLPQPIVLN